MFLAVVPCVPMTCETDTAAGYDALPRDMTTHQAAHGIEDNYRITSLALSGMQLFTRCFSLPTEDRPIECVPRTTPFAQRHPATSCVIPSALEQIARIRVPWKALAPWLGERLDTLARRHATIVPSAENGRGYLQGSLPTVCFPTWPASLVKTLNIEK
jgi:hypothetical protein